jgi:multidrug transporter EmrE-like cation transporter
MGLMNLSFTPWLLIFAASINSCAGNLLLKYSRKTAVPGLVGLLFSPWFTAGVLFYAVNVVLFAKALDALPVSKAYPVLAGSTFVFTAITGVVFLGETPSIKTALGMFFVVIGIILLAK